MEDRQIAALCAGPGVPNQGLSHPMALGLGRLVAVTCTMTWCRLEMAAEEGEKREREREHRRFENRSVGSIWGRVAFRSRGLEKSVLLTSKATCDLTERD